MSRMCTPLGRFFGLIVPMRAFKQPSVAKVQMHQIALKKRWPRKLVEAVPIGYNWQNPGRSACNAPGPLPPPSGQV